MSGRDGEIRQRPKLARKLAGSIDYEGQSPPARVSAPPFHSRKLFRLLRMPDRARLVQRAERAERRLRERRAHERDARRQAVLAVPDRKSTRLNASHTDIYRMPSS